MIADASISLVRPDLADKHETNKIKSSLFSSSTMASKKAAESTLYHLSPQGFWKKFREFLLLIQLFMLKSQSR